MNDTINSTINDTSTCNINKRCALCAAARDIFNPVVEVGGKWVIITSVCGGGAPLLSWHGKAEDIIHLCNQISLLDIREVEVGYVANLRFMGVWENFWPPYIYNIETSISINPERPMIDVKREYLTNLGVPANIVDGLAPKMSVIECADVQRSTVESLAGAPLEEYVKKLAYIGLGPCNDPMRGW